MSLENKTSERVTVIKSSDYLLGLLGVVIEKEIQNEQVTLRSMPSVLKILKEHPDLWLEGYNVATSTSEIYGKVPKKILGIKTGKSFSYMVWHGPNPLNMPDYVSNALKRTDFEKFPPSVSHFRAKVFIPEDEWLSYLKADVPRISLSDVLRDDVPEADTPYIIEADMKKYVDSLDLGEWHDYDAIMRSHRMLALAGSLEAREQLGTMLRFKQERAGKDVIRPILSHLPSRYHFANVSGIDPTYVRGALGGPVYLSKDDGSPSNGFPDNAMFILSGGKNADNGTPERTEERPLEKIV